MSLGITAAPKQKLPEYSLAGKIFVVILSYLRVLYSKEIRFT